MLWYRRGLGWAGALTLTAVLAVAPLAAPAAAAPTNLVANGSFEQPSLAGSGTGAEFYFANGTSWPIANLTLAGWTVDAQSVDVDTAGIWQAADGSQSVDLSGFAPGTISQVLATQPGDPYALSFAMSGNPFCGPQTVQVAVDWNGATVATPTFDTSSISQAVTDMEYVTHTYTVMATGTSTELKFQSLTDSSCGPVIDAVSVTSAYASLCNLVQQDATKAGVAQSLCAKLSAAEADAVRGSTHAQAGVLGAFANEVAAQTGKALTTNQATQILALAAQL